MMRVRMKYDFYQVLEMTNDECGMTNGLLMAALSVMEIPYSSEA